jgi:quaternary ammonium compound-resistance protein SugE
MAWFVLIIAGLLEVCWAVCLKHAKGFTQLWPSIGFVVSMIASVSLLGVALKSLPLGTAYAIWTGIGAVGTVIVGIALFGEATDMRRLFCVSLILAGIAGLKYFSEH